MLLAWRRWLIYLWKMNVEVIKAIGALLTGIGTVMAPVMALIALVYGRRMDIRDNPSAQRAPFKIDGRMLIMGMQIETTGVLMVLSLLNKFDPPGLIIAVLVTWFLSGFALFIACACTHFE